MSRSSLYWMQNRRLGLTLSWVGGLGLIVGAFWGGLASPLTWAGLLCVAGVGIFVAGLVLLYPLTEVARRACLGAVGVVLLDAVSDLEYLLFGIPHVLHFAGGLALVSLGIGLFLHRLGRRRGEADVGYWLGHEPASGFATIFLVVCVLILAAHLLLLGGTASWSGVDLPLGVQALADAAVLVLAIRALVRSPAPAPGSTSGPEHLPGTATKRLARPWVGGTTELARYGSGGPPSDATEDRSPPEHETERLS